MWSSINWLRICFIEAESLVSVIFRNIIILAFSIVISPSEIFADSWSIRSNTLITLALVIFVWAETFNVSRYLARLADVLRCLFLESGEGSLLRLNMMAI